VDKALALQRIAERINF